MAIYKGREVQIIGKVGGYDTSPLYTIQHRDGNREDVKLDHVQITEAEKKEAEKGAVWHLEGTPVIKDKDLQDLRDSQDKKKIEENQKKHGSGPVEVSKVMVDPAEVQDKSTITPQMTRDQRQEKKQGK